MQSGKVSSSNAAGVAGLAEGEHSTLGPNPASQQHLSARLHSASEGRARRVDPLVPLEAYRVVKA